MNFVVRTLSSATLLLLTAAPLFSQATGTVMGTVVEARTMRPLSGAQVQVVGTGIGALTNADGRFMLVNVAAGATTIRAGMIGHGSLEQPVTVSAGETTTLDFELEEQALALDEVVVTGTAGGEQRRAVGNVVSRIDAAAVTEMLPVPDV